jgi:hypothetical protein
VRFKSLPRIKATGKTRHRQDPSPARPVNGKTRQRRDAASHDARALVTILNCLDFALPCAEIDASHND